MPRRPSVCFGAYVLPDARYDLEPPSSREGKSGSKTQFVVYVRIRTREMRIMNDRSGYNFLIFDERVKNLGFVLLET